MCVCVCVPVNLFASVHFPSSVADFTHFGGLDRLILANKERLDFLWAIHSGSEVLVCLCACLSVFAFVFPSVFFFNFCEICEAPLPKTSREPALGVTGVPGRPGFLVSGSMFVFESPGVPLRPRLPRMEEPCPERGGCGRRGATETIRQLCLKAAPRIRTMLAERDSFIHYIHSSCVVTMTLWPSYSDSQAEQQFLLHL